MIGSGFVRAQAWIQTMLLTANLFPLTCFGIAAVLNTIAIWCGCWPA